MSAVGSLVTRETTVAARVRVAVTGVAAISILLAAIALYAVWWQYTLQVRTDDLSRQVYAIARGLAAGGPVDFTADQILVGESSRLFAVQTSLLGVQMALTDVTGEVYYTPMPESTRPTFDLDELTGEPDELGVRSGTSVLEPEGRVIAVVAPVEATPEDGYLVAVLSVQELAGARQAGALVMIGVALIAVMAAWVVGSIVANRVTAPLVRLRQGAEAVANGAWGLQVPVEGDVEVAALATTFNEMSRAVDAAYTAQREFVADVSHEIRTPVTSIQGFAGVLAGDAATDDAQRVRFATIIRQETTRLIELTGTLLDLAAAESGRSVPAREPVDVAALAEALRTRYEPQADERGITLEIGELGAEGRPLADEARVLQVASALVTNALKHASESGTVRVTARTADGRWCLAVDDSGPGVPAGQRERIFERFVRLDDTRASTDGGSGLGLSICQRLAHLMDGTVAVADSDLGGARFSVCLPLAERSA